MADTGIYGNPFSYLDAGAKDVRSSFRQEAPPRPAPEAEEEEQEEKQPFSYLTTSPAKLRPDGARGPGDGSDRDSAELIMADKPHKDRGVDFDSLYQPPPPNHYASQGFQEHTNPGYVGDPPAGYMSLERGSGYTRNSDQGFRHSDPRQNDQGFPPHGDPGYPPQAERDSYTRQQQPSSFDPPPPQQDYEYEAQPKESSVKVRPNSRDSALGNSYRSNSTGAYDSGKAWGCCCVAFTIVVTAILCLGAGFAAGWFVYQAVVVVPGMTQQVSAGTTPVEAVTAATQPPPPSVAVAESATPAPTTTTTTAATTPTAAPPNTTNT